MKWGIGAAVGGAIFALCTGGWGQEQAAPTLAELKAHPEERPAQVALKTPVPFKVLVEGKEVGSVTAPAQTIVDLLSVGDTTIDLLFKGNRATAAPEQTDLWERVRQRAAELAVVAAAAEKALRGDDDPAYLLQLPADSAPAPWYRDQISQRLDPWIAGHPKSPLLDEMKARRQAFADEAARVEKGEARHGVTWMTADQAAEWADEAASDALRAQIAAAGSASDAATLLVLLPQVEAHSKAATYPALVRASLAAVDAVLPALASDAQKQKDALAAQRPPLAAVPVDAEDKVLARLPEAPARVQADDWAGARAILDETERAWPENEAGQRLRLDMAETVLGKVGAALGGGDIAKAVTLYAFANGIAEGSPFPRAARLRAALDELAPKLDAAGHLQAALDRNDQDAVLADDPPGTSADIRRWHAGLRDAVNKRRADSDGALLRIKDDALHGRPGAVLADYQKAKDLWPGNPKISYVLRGAEIGAAVAGLLLLFFLLFLWDRLSALSNEIAYRRQARRQAKEGKRRR